MCNSEEKTEKKDEMKDNLAMMFLELFSQIFSYQSNEFKKIIFLPGARRGGGQISIFFLQTSIAIFSYLSKIYIFKSMYLKTSIETNVSSNLFLFLLILLIAL